MTRLGSPVETPEDVMSFRLFIYYCAAWGAAAALFGWVLGQLIAGDTALWGATKKGLALGLFLALGLALLDVQAAGARQDRASLTIRLMLALLIGALGGLIGGFIGQVLYAWLKAGAFLVFGWMLTGVLIGIAPCTFDYLGAVMRNEERRGTQRKLRNGLIGGITGGFLGGTLSLILNGMWAGLFKDAEATSLWSPSAMGFVALGACIGLAISLVQVILREATLRVESGFRPGRQLLLSKPETTIGRAESCDLGLFGDPAVEKLHAKITRQGHQWLLSDNGTPSGTMLNRQRITGPTPLHSGDRIGVGNSVLSFELRTKEPAPVPTAAPPTAVPAT
jgi:hypothetical protein